MPSRLPARGATVLAALLIGVASVPELTTAASAAGDSGEGAAAESSPESSPASSPTSISGSTPTVATYDEILPTDLPGDEVLDDRPGLVPEIAERTGLGVAETAQLLEDSTARVSTTGRVFVVDAPQQTGATGDAGAAGDGSDDEERRSARATTAGELGARPEVSADLPTSETFRLESRPGARRTIFLDVDGAQIASPNFWRDNSGFAGGSVPGFDQDGRASVFTQAEHAWVQEVWRQVAEAYAPFDVNVTTVDRGQGAWQRASPGDTTWGTRVVVTSSASVQDQLCGGVDCAGVAIIGSFGVVDQADYYQPAWAFADARLTPTLAAQTISHEVGHTLGLDHDGQGASDYSFGSQLWGPIMGGGMSRAISQWSRGEYFGASNGEDDLRIIAGSIPLVADDHGDTLPTATALGSAAQQDVAGLISTAQDVDLVRLDLACSGPFDARVAGIGPQTTLDARLDLLDASGAAVAPGSDPTSGTARADARSQAPTSTGMDAGIQVTELPAGTYYLRVDGVGRGSALASNFSGYSDYASLGRYRLTTSACGGSAAGSPTPTPSTTPSPTGAPSGTPAPTTTARPRTAPSAPRSVRVAPGKRGGARTVAVRWSAPRTTGGTLTGYRVSAYQLDRRGRVRTTYTSGTLSPKATAAEVRLPRGRYTVAVQAQNAVGRSALSARSGRVTAR